MHSGATRGKVQDERFGDTNTEVKTRSVEARAGIGKGRLTAKLTIHPFDGLVAGSQGILDFSPRPMPLSSLSLSSTGMQNNGLTMFASLVIVVRFREYIQACCVLLDFVQMCARTSGGAFEKRVSGSEYRFGSFSSLKRSCGAFCPYVEGYAGRG